MRPNWWSLAPILKLLIPFLTAISYVFVFNAYELELGVCAILLGLAAHLYLKTASQQRLKNWNSFPLIFFGVFVIYVWQMEEVRHQHASQLINNAKEHTVLVRSNPKVKPNSVYVEGEWIEGSTRQSAGPYKKVNLYLHLDFESKLNIGDTLVFEKRINPIENRINSNFDYESYCRNKGIMGSIYLGRGEVNIIEGVEGDVILMMKKFQLHLGDRISGFLKTPTHRGIVKALVIGQKAELDQTLKQQFANVGVVHVLAVSGLHVGIVYLMLSSMLSFLRRQKVIRLIIIFMGIWMFALLSGLSNSVTRACLMFTIIEVGKTLRQRTYIYSAIGFSAFLLLVHRPYVLLDVGFQLSYAAVLGIVFFQPYMFAKWKSSYKLVQKGLETMAVTLAAQLGTMPFTLLYFKKFPTYFLLANALILPMIPIVIYMSLICIICQEFGIEIEYLILSLQKTLDVVIWISNAISHFPIPTLDFPRFTLMHTVLLMMGLLAIWQSIQKRKNPVGVMTTLLLFFSIMIW